MEETAPNEALQTDLPAPKPTRKRRWPLRLAAFALAGSALFAAYWFTRPPELVWWASPTMYGTNHRLRALIPAGWVSDDGHAWEAVFMADIKKRGLRKLPPSLTDSITIEPRRRSVSKWIRWMLPQEEEYATITLYLRSVLEAKAVQPGLDIAEFNGLTHVNETSDPMIHAASRRIRSLDYTLIADVGYIRSDARAFNRTYKQICDSLTIE